MKKHLSISELAEILGLSRTSVYRKVKAGEIGAVKVGRRLMIPRETVSEILGESVSDARKAEIETAVKRTVKEYGEVLILLGKE